MPLGAANGLAAGHTRNNVRGHWKWALEGVSWGLRSMCRSGAPTAMQPMWTPDTHAFVSEPARR